MKVLFVSTRYFPYEVGGAEVTVRLLAEGLVRDGDQAVVVTLAPDGRPTEQVINGVRVHYVPLFNVFFPHGPERHPAWRRTLWQLIEAWNPVMAHRLTRIVDQEAPDLVHIHNPLGFTCAIWPALSRRQVPVLQTLHDHYAACVNSLMYRPGSGNCEQRCRRCKVLCAPRIRLSRHVSAITTVSARLWERLSSSRVFPNRRITRVIHNCNADAPAAHPRVAQPRPGLPLRIGFLGRLEPIKGPQILLEAAQRIGAGRVHVLLGGSGTPEYERALKGRYEPALATFLGRVSPPLFFADVDILVAPSLVEEASGRVVHEAFGFGVPVVGVAAGGMPELIQEGITGFILPPGDVSALENLLRRLLDDPPDWSELSAAALRQAERFRFENVFGAYRAAWNEARLLSTPSVPTRLRGATPAGVLIHGQPGSD